MVTGGVFGVTGSGFRIYRFGISRFGVRGSALGLRVLTVRGFRSVGVRGSRFGVFVVCGF